ncbi:hypothetical protein [Amycolatopsis palatopharyngis]|uniref:hypothetical protein n=1 Tax=Amycolatopsis palatopharyngis TaxID=187982 RepID=UPI000E26A5A1|nr:hypothetical protein [Amycolatopsis palatopharyngis]
MPEQPTIKLPEDWREQLGRAIAGDSTWNNPNPRVQLNVRTVALLESWRVPEGREEPVNLCETPEDAARRFAGQVGDLHARIDAALAALLQGGQTAGDRCRRALTELDPPRVPEPTPEPWCEEHGTPARRRGCARCGQPSPSKWCAVCVDRCHEATEFDHSCMICRPAGPPPTEPGDAHA